MALCSEGGPSEDWGTPFLIALTVCVAMYVGGGIGYGVKVAGAEPGGDSPPAQRSMVSTHAICRCL